MTNALQFTLNDGIYESNKQQVVAVGVNYETGEALKALEAMHTIVEGGKGYQLKRTLFGGRRQHIKTFKTVEAAIKYANKYDN